MESEELRSKRTCPVCGRTYTEPPAISRRSRAIEICPECGTREAIEDWNRDQEERTETHARDTIYRQVAIDAVDAIGHIATMPDGDKCVRRSAVKYTLSMLPPAQPEERTEKRTETYACDLISRQAAIDLLSDYANTVSLDEKLNVSARIAIQIGITNCIGIVNHNIPSVQPERKKGKWKFEKMKHIINGEVRDAIICSECDSGYFRYDISDNTVQNIPNFCPNCGADMRGGQDE